ncbi:iron-containing alcohol dehydrogenase [Clavibacter michiganensis subsp. insidiosus]|uniref:Iron-containing alcohol dehydrogenase n=2 Tax=Clavibacter michiganensis TaxID=28447 RepID=A0A399N3Z2_9MICO|nr:iron-containing alcohol dehydrogenase [Clavibacter michiganensis]AWF96941.1 hypothetical protein BEH61_00315 [Clavibacter michiganensis subsp. insidiosus]OQJ58627.1 hypothetical protein B5P21_00965 [Clavibacter michiganensis subsp. insidiosus]RII87899.1 iron-containing alcohol dehydrogenase [Clavibacter michiganensis subsp. insidiosus]RIJ44727.1 iron-containing alcohol dehydrogenase [Clavibacter michiganensis subsp. insidiosus]RMC83489.1 iron-containing alcohol dehydrogenase [Clavibacter mi
MTPEAARAQVTAHPGGVPTVIGAGMSYRPFPRLGATNDALLVIDAAVREKHPELGRRARWVLEIDATTSSQRELLDRIAADGLDDDVTSIVGIGGGSTMDTAKLIRLASTRGDHLRAARQHAETFGIHFVPEAPRLTRLPLVLVPTTLGTGSEASSVACLEGVGSRRLVAGSAMRADSIVIDPMLARSLPERDLREGAAEILLHVVGAYVGSAAADVQDGAAEELAGRVARFARTAVEHGSDERLRTLLAVASAETHTGWALAGRDPYAAKHWYLANEMSSAADTRKVPTTLRILPAIWRSVMSGERRLGDGERLERIWRIIALELSLPLDPVAGARAWNASWGIDRPVLSEAAVASAAKSCFRIWAGRRPALRGMTEDEIVAVYADRSASDGYRARGIPLFAEHREEVKGNGNGNA